MSLRVAVQMDPLESINIAGDSSFALMLAAQAVFVDRQREFFDGRAPFDLDKGHRPATPGNEIDLAARSLHPPRDDPPAMQPQPPPCPALAPPAAALGERAFHLSSSARA